MSSSSQKRWEDGWSNATGNNKYALIGWLNTSLSEIWAMDLEDLSCKLPKEVNKMCEALETLGIREILKKPGVAILAKIRVVSWTSSAIEDMIPPAMMWSYCKIYPAKSEIVSLSELAVKNGGLYRTGSGRAKGEGLLIPNGITEIGFLRGPTEQRTDRYLEFWEEVRKKTEQNKLEEWRNKYFDPKKEADEYEKWLGQPPDLDMDLLRRTTDCLIMIADGSNSWETKLRLVVGPYNKEHAKNVIQKEEAKIEQQREEEKTTSLLRAENKQTNVEGIPFSVSGISKSKSKLSCLITIPYGLHPLNLQNLTWKREILGVATTACQTITAEVEKEMKSIPTRLLSAYYLHVAMDNAVSCASDDSFDNELATAIDDLCLKTLSQSAGKAKKYCEHVAKLIRQREDTSTKAIELSNFNMLERSPCSWLDRIAGEGSEQDEIRNRIETKMIGKFGRSLNGWLQNELKWVLWGEGSTAGMIKLKVKKADITGNAEDLENLIFNMMAKLTGNAVEAERISASISSNGERATGRNRTGKRMRESPDEVRVMKPRLTSSPIDLTKMPNRSQRNGQSPQEDNITTILLQGEPNDLERSISLNIATESEEHEIPIPDLSSLDISRPEESTENDLSMNAKMQHSTMTEKAKEKETSAAGLRQSPREK
ncbi:unnamed protein product [Oikopleura dioica]|uniref:Uncharacterized protein n=1 Tax=Oikopleura dioica TaxID=34765 RepID=E4XYD4_OIKDI|nr:unnamed protein product [Oikopleura dioica]